MYEKIKEMNEQMNNIRNIKDIYNRNARWYDFLVKPIEFFLLRKKRRKLVVPLSGKILEIGVGTGANLAYYRNDISFIGVDASPEMLKIAQRKAERHGISADFREMDAENLEFPDGYFDAVVSTLTLCTVPHPVQAVREMARVCKGGGRLLFLLIEKIKGSRMNPKVANTANMVGFSLLIFFMLVITYHDVIKLL